jgi:hypothetical protein
MTVARESTKRVLEAIDEFSGPLLGAAIRRQRTWRRLPRDPRIPGGLRADLRDHQLHAELGAPGDAFFKISVEGRPIYTVYIDRPDSIAQNPNAVVKAAQIILALEEWAYAYEQKNRYEYAGGAMIPKVAIGAVRGGTPTKPLHTSALLVRQMLSVEVLDVAANNHRDKFRRIPGSKITAGLPGGLGLHRASRRAL